MSKRSAEDERLVALVMSIHRLLVEEGFVHHTNGWTMKKCTWDDPSRFGKNGKLSCIGSNINDVYATQKLRDGTWYEQFQFAGPNCDTEFVPIALEQLQCFCKGADGNNPRLFKQDGSRITVADQLADAERIIGTALKDGVKVDLVGPDADIRRKGMYKVVVTFNEVDDLDNDDVNIEQCTQVVSYSSGSGAKNIALITGGFGTSIKVLDGDGDCSYGSRTKVRPSLDVGGKRYEFNVRITPQVDASGKAVKITQSGNEDKASAERAIKKNLSPEMPVGPTNCSKKSTTLVCIFPIEQLGPPPLVYRSLGASAGPFAPGAEDEDEEDEEDEEDDEEQPEYRSLSVAGAAPVEAAFDATLATATAAALAPLSVTVPDTSSDEAIATALQEEEAMAKAPDSTPPIVGDKRSISNAERVEPEDPMMNMRLSRQSMCPISNGPAPMIKQDIKVSFTNGVPVFTQFLSVCIKRGTGPLRGDLLAIDALVGKCKMEAMLASGVSGVKKLSGAYAESMGATSSAPMTMQDKCDVQATLDSVNVNAPVTGVLVEGLF